MRKRGYLFANFERRGGRLRNSKGKGTDEGEIGGGGFFNYRRGEEKLCFDIPIKLDPERHLE